MVGAKAGYDFGGGLTAFVDARNLFDKTHISNVGVVPTATAANWSVFNPGDGRAVHAGLQWRW